MMILSFHPCYEADKNIIVAGREPDESDRLAIKDADIVILPQGCSKTLYSLCKRHCSKLFPNFDAKFKFPGKTGQARLFESFGAPFPTTRTFSSIKEWPEAMDRPGQQAFMPFPFVFKLDWGGEGDGVFLIRSREDLKRALKKAADFERTGAPGFLVQEYIETWDKTLRVVVIGSRFISYWRVQEQKNIFGTSVSKGARIQKHAHPTLQKAAVDMAEAFCRQSKINLAGFDFIFKKNNVSKNEFKPLFLEINYFFGRQGLGGSEAFYKMLVDEINKWIKAANP